MVLITHTCDVTVLAQNGDLHPYHTSNGGPLTTMDDLFTDQTAKEVWKRRLEFISYRWGGSDRIAMWELYNELLNCGGSDPVAAEAWVEEMGQHLRSYELWLYGAAHPVVVSTVHLLPENDFFYESPGTDLMVTHYYRSYQQYLWNPVLLARDIHEVTVDNLSAIDFRTPFLENERTLGGALAPAFQKELEHAAAWSYLASGAAGTGATWVKIGEWALFREKDVVADTHAAMAPILEQIDFTRFNSRPLDVPSSDPELLPLVVSDGQQALGWVLHNNPDDYFIEMIQGWIANDGTVPLLNAVVLPQWLRIADDQGAPIDVDDFIVEIRDLILLYADIPLAQAQQLAESALNDPYSLQGSLPPELADHTEELISELIDIFGRLRSMLIAEEETSGTLAGAYRGHPEVATNLTLSGFDPGEHTIIWYDDTSGVELTRLTVDGTQFELASPTFRKHVAFVVR